MSDQPNTFEADVQEAVAPVLTEMRGIRDEVVKVKTDLLHRMETGDKPDSEETVDLEERLAAAEQEARAATDEIRKIQTKNSAMLAAKEDKARDVFNGLFLENASELRAMKRDRGVEAMTRALTSGTTLSSAGALNAEQEDQFLDWLVEQQQALSRVQIRRMSASQAYLDELVTGTRKLRAGTEATDATVADGFSTARRSLTTVETVWPEDLSYNFIEDNIERGDIESHIARNLATAFGNDHNDLFWNGDEDNSDAFLGINDGIIDIAKADGSVNDSDATSVTAWTEVFEAALKLMPYSYQALMDHVFFIPFKGIYNYMDELSDRATALGDVVTEQGRTALRYFGVPIVGEPHLDAGDEAVLTPLRNLIWGVQRGVTFEQERNPRKRVIEYTVSARTDQNYSKSAAVVLIDGLESSLTD